MGTKEKLTLSVDKEVVEKAKELGINISELTEKVLAGFTFEPTKVEESQIKTKYRELFDTMKPLLQKFNIPVKVGEIAKYDERTHTAILIGSIELYPDGYLWSPDFEEGFDIQKLSTDYLLPPNRILAEFINGITEGAKKQKQRLKELEVARKMIEAISGFMEGK